MSTANTYQAVRIGDIADWRLICRIADDGMSAYLKHSDPMQEVVTLFDEKWDTTPEQLLSKIENTVYDHPQVLDDFSADIVIEAPKSIWVPLERVEDDEEKASYLYNQVYKAEENDIMTDDVADACCLYCLVPGLKAFLQRTFPGARVHSHLALMARRFRERNSDMPRVYADIREGAADILAFDNRNMLMAATHTWHAPEDIQYHIWNIMNVYGLKPDETQVSLSGLREVKNRLLGELRKNISFVMLTMLPSLASKPGMATSAALLLRI